MQVEYKIERFFVAACILLFPMIGSISRGPGFLGGLGKEGSFYPAAIFMMVFILGLWLEKRNLYFPNMRYARYLCCFLIVALFSLVFNLSDLLPLTFKGQSGLSRAAMQYGSLCVYVLMAICFFNFFRRSRDSGEFLSKWVIYSAFFSALYSIFEMGALLGDDTCRSIRASFDELFRSNAESHIGFDYALRLRSLADEASFFALYSGIVLPWIMMGILSHKGRKQLILVGLFIVYLIMNIFSFSRTGYVILAFEVMAFLFLMRKEIAFRRFFSSIGMILIALASIFASMPSNSEVIEKIDVVSIFQSIFVEDDVHELSNVARYGTQEACLQIFKEHPLFGVGYGEFGFYASDNYPNAAWKSGEIRAWASNVVPGPWPPAHSLYARLLAETGVCGVIPWLLFWGILIIQLYRRMRISPNREERYQILSLIVSFLGIVCFGFGNDSMRTIAQWCFLGFAWNILSKNSRMEVSNRQK